jgi:hypothetical protein
MNIASNNRSPSPATDTMPTEKTFLRQAGLVREALKTFLAIRDLDAPNVIRPALADLIKYTVRSFILT